MSTLTRIVCDFAEFYGEPLRHLCDALNNDRTFECVLAVIGVAGLVVIGVTL